MYMYIYIHTGESHQELFVAEYMFHGHQLIKVGVLLVVVQYTPETQHRWNTAQVPRQPRRQGTLAQPPPMRHTRQEGRQSRRPGARRVDPRRHSSSPSLTHRPGRGSRHIRPLAPPPNPQSDPRRARVVRWRRNGRLVRARTAALPRRRSQRRRAGGCR